MKLLDFYKQCDANAGWKSSYKKLIDRCFAKGGLRTSQKDSITEGNCDTMCSKRDRPSMIAFFKAVNKDATLRADLDSFLAMTSGYFPPGSLSPAQITAIKTGNPCDISKMIQAESAATTTSGAPNTAAMTPTVTWTIWSNPVP